MPVCECCGQMPGYCRRCRTEASAVHLRDLYEAEHSRVAHHSDVARLPFDRLTAAAQAGWLAVAIAARDMER